MPNGGVALSWSAGQHASRYDVYREVTNVDQQFQLVATVTGTTYTDASATAIKYAHAEGITYAIFAVGPTGVENPSDTVVSVS